MDASLSMFATWLSAGLTWAVTATSPRLVSSGYFRMCMQVVLGLLVLAILAGWQVWDGWDLRLLIGSAVVCYLASSAWYLERASAGAGLGAGLSVLLLGAIAAQTWTPSDGVDPLALASAFVGASLLGAGMGAMLLGHYYLTAPWMSLAPVRRLIAAIFVAALARGVVTGIGTERLLAGESAVSLSIAEAWLYLGVRWFVGILAPIVLAIMSWRTIKLKATQAATGILYVIVICTLIGEVAAIALGRMTGVPQ